MKNKRIILSSSFFAVFLLVIIKYTNYSFSLKEIMGSQWLEIFFNTLMFTPFIFLISLLIYKLPQRVFDYWWKFARFAIPSIFILVIIINLRLHHTPGGWMNLDNEIDLVLVYALYSFFVIGSLIQIIRGYFWKN